MISALDSRGMGTGLPRMLLFGSPGNQFDGIGNSQAIHVVNNQQMDVIGCYGIIEDYQAITLFSVEKPL